MFKVKRGDVLDSKREVINRVLVTLFNNILHIEEKALKTGPYKNLTISELHVIEAIGKEGPSPMSVIAAKLYVTVGTLTIAINNLVRKGYVMRERSETDRRVVLIQLTDLGVDAHKHHEIFHNEMIEYTMASLSDEESDVLTKALSKITDYFAEKYT
nr:MarR family transcriptional regulator [Fusibacter tunisiensis]